MLRKKPVVDHAAPFKARGPHSPCRLGFAPCLPEPERLVGLGFRYWMHGRMHGDIGAWERAWRLYCGLFGAVNAKVAVTGLAAWVGALERAACREIEVFPVECRSFCRDECVAVSMIAACQHNTCPAMRACALALAESSMIDSIVGNAQAFADALMGLDQVLSPASIVAATVEATPTVHWH